MVATPPVPAGSASRVRPRRCRHRLLLLLLALLVLTLASVLLLVALELALRLGFALKDRVLMPPFPDPRLVAEGYDGADWIGTHLREYESLQACWQPYVYFRQRPCDGQTIHVDAAGRRRTWQPSNQGDHGASRPRVFVLGGSVVWGVGARDEATIPSALARELHERGIDAEVVNLAEIGHVSTQQALTLLAALRAGQRPDLVISIEGVNDVLAAYQNGVPGLPQQESNRAREFAAARSVRGLIAETGRELVADSALLRLARSVGARLRTGSGPASTFAPPAATGQSLAEQAAGILAVEADNRRWIEDLARRHGFACRFYRQPLLFTKRQLRPFEQDERAKYAAFAPLYEAVEAQARQADDPRPLGPVLDDEPGLMFLDFCHLTEAASARIARAIAEDVARALADRAGRSARAKASMHEPVTSRPRR